MDKIELKKIKHVYALDNGNGNLMAYRINMQVAPQKRIKEPIVDKEGEPAGFAMTPNGKMQLGKQLEGVDYNTFAACKIMPVNFKAIPTDDNRDMMVRYLRGWLERMQKNCPSIAEDGEDAVWFVGCPNGWKSPKILAEYRDIFVEAGYANPVIVPESNAAMMHFLMTNTALAQQAADGVMCVDAGAYSNDGSFVQPGQVRSLGSFVGASLIEKMIIGANLYAEQAYRKGDVSYNEPLLTEAVRKRFETDEVFCSFLLLQGRWLKERYFTQKKDGTLPVGGKDLRVQVYLDDYSEFQGKDIFTLFVNTKMVEDLLTRVPVRNVLGDFQFSKLSQETRNEIGAFTWKDCFANFLHRLAEDFPEFKERAMAADGPKAVVMLTGGASQMDIIPLTILETYPNVRLEMDLTPVLSIAMGLMDFAPEKLRAMAFDQAFNAILDEEITIEDGEKVSLVAYWLDKAHQQFCTDTCSKIALYQIDDLADAVKAWQAYTFRSDQITQEANKQFEDHFDNDICPGLIEDSRKANELLIENINNRFRSLLEDSGIVDVELFSEKEMHLEFTDLVVSELMPEIKKFILDVNDSLQESLFSKFPNPGRFALLQMTRPEWFLYNNNTVTEYLEEINTEIFKGLVQLFYQNEMRDTFILESVYEIYKELKNKKRTLLGDLIVEESYDDEEEDSGE